jgi:hypothetical protein
MSTEIQKISKRRFDTLCYIRNPHLRALYDEVAWFDAFNGKLIATIFIDYTDMDFGYVILGRDAQRIFRGIVVSNEFFDTMDEAEKELRVALNDFASDGQEIYPQGDEKRTPHEVLVPKVKEEKLHTYFKVLIAEERFEAARNLIREIVYTYVDVDGNYIKDFQSTGFDARLWELYLYAYFHMAGFSLDKTHQSPDYLISIFDKSLAVEAVSVNRSEAFDAEPPTSLKESHILRRDYMPIKFGSALFSKLQKKYWDLDQVKGKPLIIAIHDYHMQATPTTLGSMTWSRMALMDYLYGVRMVTYFDTDDRIVMEIQKDENGVRPKLEKIIEHTWEKKTIPSNFFSLPDSENVSAVLFSNNATITAFNRIGKLAGIGSKNIKMLRFCALYNPDPFATDPIFKTLDVDSPEYEESWGDGLLMYHNPNAKIPVDPNLLPDISHIFF